MKEPQKEPSVAEISALAYQLYVEDGEVEGRAEVHWHRAEEILRHPEQRPAENMLAPPSEPEITRTLDAKAEVLDADLPSDPHSGPEAYHQHLDFAADHRGTKEVRAVLRDLPGVESVEDGPEPETVRISFDARRTNPAAIIELLTPTVAEAEATL